MESEIRELTVRHDTILKQMGDMLDAYKGTEQTLTAEEEQQFDRLNEEADRIVSQINRMKTFAGKKSMSDTPATSIPLPGSEGGVEQRGEEQPKTGRNSLQHKADYREFLTRGPNALRSDTLDRLKEYQAGLDEEGGYLVAPMEYMQQILRGVEDQVQIRALGRKIELPKAESLGVPTLENGGGEAQWTSELRTGNNDDSVRFGMREMFPHPLAMKTRISRKLIRSAWADVEGLILSEFSRGFAVAEERAFMYGDGIQKPLGLFTANVAGIPASQDMPSGHATSITADALINMAYDLKPQYWNSGSFRWIMHRYTLREIRKLKDGIGNYLWSPGLEGRGGQTILGIPLVMSEFAPNDQQTGEYALMLGDLSYYWIVDALQWQFQVLTELYAETNQNGYIGRREVDGQPVLAEAFRRMKYGTTV